MSPNAQYVHFLLIPLQTKVAKKPQSYGLQTLLIIQVDLLLHTHPNEKTYRESLHFECFTVSHNPRIYIYCTIIYRTRAIKGRSLLIAAPLKTA